MTDYMTCFGRLTVLKLSCRQLPFENIVLRPPSARCSTITVRTQLLHEQRAVNMVKLRSAWSLHRCTSFNVAKEHKCCPREKKKPQQTVKQLFNHC